MYVILTSRDGQYRTEISDGLLACETYDYLFYGEKKARFVIASLEREVKIRVVEENPPRAVNAISSKFLEKFATVEAARARLRELVGFGDMDMQLCKIV
jgi:hypothetical protein